jgi:hypothetical protein
MLVRKIYFLFRALLVLPRTTNNGTVARSFPKRGRTFGSAHCVSFVWLCPDYGMSEAWQSWDFAVLGKVVRNRGMFMVVDPSGGEKRVAVICLTLIMSNHRLTSPSDMSSAGVLRGRWGITAFTGFRDLG